MVKPRTCNTRLTLGPIILETLVKHYFDQLAKDHESEPVKDVEGGGVIV